MTIEIISVSSADEHLHLLAGAEAVHRQLRPHLPADYRALLRTMFGEGARMALLLEDGEVRTVAIYRTYHTTFHGYRFYVDDLITDTRQRARGLGSRMLAWLQDQARGHGCDRFDLESGVQRGATHRFYFREQLTVFAFGFTRDLRAQEATPK
jgi:GNAT superfamily N-acetyltransferase